MAYQKFAFNFTLIGQIVYEIITNKFTTIQVAAHMTPFCASNLPLQVIKDALISQNSFQCNFFCIDFKTCLQKRIVSK